MLLKMMNLDKELDVVRAWCKKRGWEDLNRDLLSDYAFAAYKDDKPVAVCWLYPVHKSPLCWMGFPIADPDISKEDRKEALDLVFGGLHDTAKKMGYSLITTTSNTPPIEKRLKEYGYIMADTNINQYFGRLK